MNTNTSNETVSSDLVDAVKAFLTSERNVWSDQVKACQRLATADATSDLDAASRARVAAKVRLDRGSLVGSKVQLSMSSATYSKRVKVGRFASETCPDDVVAKIGDDWAAANAASDVKLTWLDSVRTGREHAQSGRNSTNSSRKPSIWHAPSPGASPRPSLRRWWKLPRQPRPRR